MKQKSIIMLLAVLVLAVIIFMAYTQKPVMSKEITHAQAIEIASQTKEAKAIVERYPNTTEIKAELWNPYEALIDVVYVNETSPTQGLSPEQANYKEWKVTFNVPNQATSAIVSIHTNGTVKSVASTSSVKCLVQKTC